MQTTSKLLPGEAVFRCSVRAGDYWIDTLRRGQALRIVDVEGNQSADTPGSWRTPWAATIP